MKQEKDNSMDSKEPVQKKYDTKGAQDGAIPSIPLPNQGEGGAVYPGNDMGNNMGNNPVTLLPNVGEGGAAFPGNMMPQMPPMGGGNNLIPTIIGTIISTHPRPNDPCRFCNNNTNRIGTVRFLNAASGYNPFRVYINENIVSSDFAFGDVTEYAKVGVGMQMITVMGENGYIFLQQQVNVMMNDYMTIAIVNTDSGLALQMISDKGCDRGSNRACIRAANLAYNSGTLSVTVGNQQVLFPNLNYRAVADFEQIWPGLYIYAVTRNTVARFPANLNQVLLTAPLQVQRDRNYTIYLLNWNRESRDTIKALIVEDM